MEIASNNNAGINNNKVEFNYSNQRSTVWDCCINFTNKMFEYRQWKFSIENRDNIIEPLYHLVRKHALTTQTKTKGFIDHILKLYEKGDIEISMATLRVIEYMDDDLLEAIKAFRNKLKYDGDYLRFLPQPDPLVFKSEHNFPVQKYGDRLRTHGLLSYAKNDSFFGNQDPLAFSPTMLEIIELIKLTEC